MSIHLPALSSDPNAPFPPGHTALRQPDGLLAMGGDLSSARLLNAYRHGIFPWYSDGQPILWWCPDPRTVFRTDGVHLSSRFRRSLRQCDWTVQADTCFDRVIAACAHTPRTGQPGTWITSGMIQAYNRLHELGHAHSIEVLSGDRLIGGLYGIAVGKMFFGESMYSAESGGSKVAVAALAKRLLEWGFPLLDAQVENDHLLSLGAEPRPRDRFLAAVSELTAEPEPAGSWTERFGTVAASELAPAGAA
ncbi:leucyl/phenylalanyl-tRNA--protein transferase [Lysobacter sp. Root494]|uniref:leucyl/phenylalanyl-tRNA--protein transferase n=1 Tax=Lysobacter sp. Root494 TaxID=1736549 RepID=UPI0006F8FA29|nr:leucyl/phenylalanyl-tRNA--protein transferase [Lysobacter sp. Root494]KQY52835.1 leucyl/phenylalanyl-tRNA--protein transferase [Lysobacter sp. Root494]